MSFSKTSVEWLLFISEVALFAFGMLLVFGLFGEHRKKENRRLIKLMGRKWIRKVFGMRSFMKIFELFVIIGVAGELLADGGIFGFSFAMQIISDKEIASLNKLAAESNERSKQLEETNLVLRAKLVALELKLQPRIITAQQLTNFIFLTERIKKIPIEIDIYAEGKDTETFAMHLRDMLSSAGFGTNDGAGPFGINRKPQFFIGNKPRITNEIPWIYFQTHSTNEIFELLPVGGETVNGQVRPIVAEPNEPRIYRAIEACFNEIGITSAWMGIPDLPPGKCAILIPIH